METQGRHLIVELWGCPPERLSLREPVEKIMVEAALESGGDIREVSFHQFEPFGVSGVVVISESHLSIHTFPEHGYASLDVYTCGGLNPHTAMESVRRALGGERYECLEVIRGERQLRIEAPQPVPVMVL
ncbi:adenosylmethionine decarboxylase [Paenibacillus alkalitolerans]|uniref:adenosylmethionine decarboxylase n=1 Tax=Paenibacillus alkalitolerans TaxID=2799335 RepID=UPI0018F3A00C|nr:adenosylmethionine decarboxylase [Paenibacillus alkalitolerans]